ncbi:MAG TPA: PLP-dependent aminotransferase family protein [Polyangiaceae bacterium]|nr:PLP-dependent aminotransferase family protein [Polyangiaceae bacterium]
MDQLLLTLAPPESEREGLAARVHRTLVSEVRRGRLRPGQLLPGSRRLAEAFGVHRNTVLVALRELEAEGWVCVEPARGTRVAQGLPAQRRRAAPPPTSARPGYDLPRAEVEASAPSPAAPLTPSLAAPLSFSGGVPDVRLLDTAALARALRRALRDPSTLRYGSPQGDPRLREALATLLSDARGVPRAADELVVTSGSQMALDLVARALFAPGARVAVEALGYRPGWEALRRAGLALVPVPVDRHGLDVEALADLARREPVAGVVLTPHHQYPTTVTLSAERRLALLELARRHRWLVVEDDYDHEFHYEGRPVLPLASADPGGNVVYVGTLSKLLAPGLRLGFVAAPRPVAARLADARRTLDREGVHAVERAVALLFEDGDVGRHARRVRRVYHARRDALVGLLAETPLTFSVPHGGTALFVSTPAEVDVERLVDRAAARGVVLQSPRAFAFDGLPRPLLRLGFAQLDLPELARAARALALALGEAAGAGGGRRGGAAAGRTLGRNRFT